MSDTGPMATEALADSPGGGRRLADRVRPELFFVGSAVFHYLGPAFAVLLFVRVEPLGVAWLRILSAGVIFALWRQPWRAWAAAGSAERRTVVVWGALLALMNASFYLALDRLPLSTVAAIEFAGPILLAAIGLRTVRNLAALALAVVGVAALADVSLAGSPVGFGFAIVNMALFTGYIIAAHRVSRHVHLAGIDGLAMAMLIAAAFDQLAMRRLARATYALLVALLPATATVIGILVLAQIPTLVELLGVGLVIAAVAVHREHTSLASADTL